MKQASYTDAFYMYKNLIAKEYEKHKIILESNKILDSEKEVFQNIMEQRADQNVYLNSIRTLSDILAKYYKKNVIILIDEYDVPLENAYHEGFYDDMTNLICSCFESALKTNPSLEFAVLTGCLRVVQREHFHGLEQPENLLHHKEQVLPVFRIYPSGNARDFANLLPGTVCRNNRKMV